MLTFGSIFRYREDFYVYFLETEDICYAAKILDEEITRQLLTKRDNLWKNQRDKSQNQNVLCFVLLTTEKFERRAAHYGRPKVNIGEYEELGKINEVDLDQLKKEVVKDTAVPMILRESITKMFPD